MQYSSEEDAANAAREYNLRVVFADMGAYPCTRHEAWHIGHHDKHSGARQAMKALVEFFMLLEIQYPITEPQWKSFTVGQQHLPPERADETLEGLA